MQNINTRNPVIRNIRNFKKEAPDIRYTLKKHKNAVAPQF